MDFLIGVLRGRAGTIGSALDTTIGSRIDAMAGSTYTGAEGTSEAKTEVGITGEEE